MIMNKIYIIGPVASGKTTLAKKLSTILNIPYYELDNVIYKSKDVKRNQSETAKRFNKIINSKKWIIEDVGRAIFKEGIDKADVIYFMNISHIKIYYRIIKRWLKQKLRMESCNFYPNLKDLNNMFKWAKKDFKRHKENEIPQEKMVIIKTNKDIKNIINARKYKI